VAVDELDGVPNPEPGRGGETGCRYDEDAVRLHDPPGEIVQEVEIELLLLPTGHVWKTPSGIRDAHLVVVLELPVEWRVHHHHVEHRGVEVGVVCTWNIPGDFSEILAKCIHIVLRLKHSKVREYNRGLT